MRYHEDNGRVAGKRRLQPFGVCCPCPEPKLPERYETEVVIMEKGTCALIKILAIVSAVAAVAAAVGVFFYKRTEKKRRDEEELQQYLDCAIE